MKRCLCVVMILLFVLLSLQQVSAYHTSYQSNTCFADDSGLYRVCLSGKQAEIERIVPDNRSARLSLSYAVSGVTAHNGIVFLLCNDVDNNQLVVYTYDLDRDTLDSFCLYGLKLYNDVDFCCDNGHLYIEDSVDAKILKQFSYTGMLLHTYRFSDDITDTMVSYDGAAYVLCGNTLYRMTESGTSALSGSAQPPLYPVGGSYLSSVYGEIYRIVNGELRYCFETDSDGTEHAACIVDDILYYPYHSTVYGYEISTGEKVCYLNNITDCDLLYAYGDSVLAVGINSGTVHRWDKNEFIRIEKPAEATVIPQDNTAKGSRTDNQTSDSRSSAQVNVPSVISSDIYTVDFSNYFISGIATGTTVAQFKSNMHYDGYSVRFYRDNKEKKNGNVGTAMTAVFENDNESYTFELSVHGDLTGEGNCNSRDVNLLMDYLIGSASFNGVYTLAADLSNDGTVDVMDLALMKRV